MTIVDSSTGELAFNLELTVTKPGFLYHWKGNLI